jgi:hypothetical protein
MIRNATKLGLCLLAVLGVTSAVASSASALNYTAASYPVTINGTQSTTAKFVIGGATVSCSTATTSATSSAAGPTLTEIPIFGNCTAFGFIGATVTGFPNTGGSCDYLFGTPTLSGGQIISTVNLNCPSGDVQIDAGPCTATITAARNQGLSKNIYTNNTPAAGQITVHISITNTHVEVTTSDFGCSVPKGTYANATFTGTIVWKAEHEGKAVSIDIG